MSVATLQEIQTDIQAATETELLDALAETYRSPAPRSTILFLCGDPELLDRYAQSRRPSEDDLFLLAGTGLALPTHEARQYLHQLFTTPPGGAVLVYRGGLLGPAGVDVGYPSSQLDPPYRQAHALSTQPGIDFAAVATRYTRGGLIVFYKGGEREQFRVR